MVFFQGCNTLIKAEMHIFNTYCKKLVARALTGITGRHSQLTIVYQTTSIQ